MSYKAKYYKEDIYGEKIPLRLRQAYTAGYNDSFSEYISYEPETEKQFKYYEMGQEDAFTIMFGGIENDNTL